MGLIPALVPVELLPAVAGISTASGMRLGMPPTPLPDEVVPSATPTVASGNFGQMFSAQIAVAVPVLAPETTPAVALLAAQSAPAMQVPPASEAPLVSGPVANALPSPVLTEAPQPPPSVLLVAESPAPAPAPEATVSPGLMDIIALGLALTLPANAVGQAPISAGGVVGLEQLPRNGRPVEAQPDREAYFVAMPPSPAAESQASLVQTLSWAANASPRPAASLAKTVPGAASAPLAEVLTGIVAVTLAHVARSDGGTPVLPPTMPLSAPVSTVPTPRLAPPVIEAVSSSVPPALNTIRPAIVPMAESGGPAETAPPVVLSEAAFVVAGVRAEPERKKAPPESLQREAGAEVIAPLATLAASTIPVIPDRPGHAPRAALPTAEPPVDIVPVTALADSATASSLATPMRSGPPVSSSPLPVSGSTVDASAAAPVPVPSSAIPFATSMLPAGVQTGFTPVVLPNPLERSIARQVTQQLAAPLATLNPAGSAHRTAAEKSLVIRLTPPELGTVRIELSQRDGQLVIRMHAEDPAVRQAIERMLPGLRSDLRQSEGPAQTISVESSSGDRSSDRQHERNPDDRGAWQGQQQHERQERPSNGGGQFDQRDGKRPIFALQGMPAAEPLAVAPRPRSLGGSSSASGVDALA